jgi:diacylglycerol kinase (ATP)
VYGGDGTVTEVASGLIGSGVPLGILPGGTSNVIAMSLGIPRDLEQACALIAHPDTPSRELFLGQINQGYFAQIIGIGMEAAMIEGATREAKDRWGWLAYGLAALQALTNPATAHYHLELDDTSVDIEGVTCLILQVDNIGIPTLAATPPGPRHGLLDVVVIRKVDWSALIAIAATLTGTDINLLNILAANLLGNNPNFTPLPHWQARQVRVTADPPQPVQADGELLGSTPIQAHMLPQPVHVLVPAPATLVAPQQG